MDGTAPASEIYFRDLHDFGLFFFISERGKNDKSVLSLVFQEECKDVETICKK